MDRRSLLFFVTVMLSFLLVNTYFSSLHEEKSKTWQEQQKAKQEKQKLELKHLIQEKTAPLSSFSTVTLYSDSVHQNIISTGIVIGDHLLVSPWNEIMPETIYSDKSSYHLIVEGKKKTAPALYSKGGKDSLPVRTLPDFGSYDLQIVTLSSLNTPPAEVYFAEYRAGVLSIPAETLKKLSPDDEINSPHASGFVFLQIDDRYVPVGYYQPGDTFLSSLTSYSYLAPWLSQAPASKNQELLDKEEKFYVLENDYQQLVFSNVGGALTEINLPFSSEKNQKSLVKEIGFDRLILEQQPQNDYFPSHAYYTARSEQEPLLHDKGELGGYYPLIRRDLMQKPPYTSLQLNPNFYSLNIVSEYPEVAEMVYKVKYFDAESIIFESVQPHRRITKTFSIAKNTAKAPYCIDLTISVEGDARGLWITTGIPDAEWISGGIAPALKYRLTKTTSDTTVKEISLPDPQVVDSTTTLDWIANSNGFLGLIVDPLGTAATGYKAIKVPGNVAPSRLLEIDQAYQRFKPDQLPGYALLLPIPEKGGSLHFRIFAGPFASSALKTMDETFSDPSIGYNPDYMATQTFHGYLTFLSQPISNFLFVLMKGFYFLTGSWAFSIILLTVALRIILYPFNAWSLKSMQKMKEVAPELAALQERYKKDPRKMQIETANLYRERGVNPFSGCLPLLLQLPFLLGMFDLLKSSFELRGASFIPGWIDDLAAPDVLFSWSYPIFFIGNAFHLLPILLGVVMFLQQKMSSSTPTDAAKMSDQQRQQQGMMTLMTVVFSVMFYHFPSGLNIYWLSSMLLGMGQQWWMARGQK